MDRTKYPKRFGESADAKAHHRQLAVGALLAPLDAALQRCSGQLSADAPGSADIAIFTFVRQFAAVEPAWLAALPFPALQG